VTRVVLRVHYLGDVLVGAALGLGVLVAMHELVDSLRVGFGVAVAATLVAVVVSGGAEPALVVGIFLAPVAVRRLDQSRQAWLSAST